MKKVLVISLLSVLLSSCGGGGSATSNAAPTANAGPDQSVVTGATVTLDGSSSSDANGDQITYAWSITSKPSSSTASLSSSTAAQPIFTADAAGSYVLSLIVSDGTLTSSSDSIAVTAATPWTGTKQMGVFGAYAYGKSVATDATGNVYVAGATLGNLDSNTLTGTEDFYVTKYDSSGVLQ